MLTVSIPEMLTMGPHAWPMYSDDADSSSDMGQWNTYGQWSLEGVHQFYTQTSHDAWGFESPTSSELAFSLPESVLPEDNLHEPLKLPTSCGGSKVPLTAFASPLRVPLPKSLTLGEEPPTLLELPPGLDDFYMDVTCEESSHVTQGKNAELFPPPPGLAMSGALVSVSAANSRKPALPTSVAPCEQNTPPHSISIAPTESGEKIHQWDIPSFLSKLQANNGRPLVSPPFTACGLENLRLIVSVDAKDLAKGKSAKGKHAVKGGAKNGPLFGSLKLKADCLEDGATLLTFNLNVGAAKAGPFTFDFSQQAVHGPDLSIDWLGQVDSITGNMRVGVELLEKQ
jgi:hypothetical protein